MTSVQSSWMSLLVVLVLLAGSLLPANPAYAQIEPPIAPTTSTAMVPSVGPPGATRDENGNWRMESDTTPVESAAIANSGGPDDFGYVWDDSVAYNWIDATSGTDTGLSGEAWNQRTGVIPLPFAFKLYDAVYSGVYVGAAGYVSFLDAPNWRWDDQVVVPSPATPNPVVAPYSTPLDLATSGNNGRVFYKAGGTAPNRYFVVTWNEVQRDGEDDKYTFQVVLHENGNILFQYKTMIYGPDGGYYCGYVGIEDPEGVDGFSYASCNTLSGNSAIRFTRPTASARVKLLPRGQGRFTRAADTEAFEVTVYNSGDLGADTYDVSLSSAWPVTVKMDGQPLTDTDGSGTVDTGPIAQSARKKLTVQVQTPTFVGIADTNTATLTLRSMLTPTWSRSSLLRTTVPAPFAQIYEDFASPGPRIALSNPSGQINRKVASTTSLGGEMAVGGAPSGGYVYVWDEWLNSSTQLKVTHLDANGASLAPIRMLATVVSGHFADLGTAVASDGNTGIAWIEVQSRQVNGTWVYNYNVMFAILDATGTVVLSPTSLTNNVAWGAWNDVGVPRYYYAHIAVSGDDRFLVAWNDYHNTGDAWTDNIYYSVSSATGQMLKPTTQLGGADMNSADSPRITALSGNRFLLAYNGYAGGVRGVRVVTLTSAGDQIAGPLQLTSNYEYPRAVSQMSNGPILLVWSKWQANQPRLVYAILSQTTYLVDKGPFDIENSFSFTGDWAPSIVTDANGRAVITWGERTWDYRPSYFYALVDSDGVLQVPATPWLTARTPANGTAPVISSSTNGYGTAPSNSLAPTSNSQPDVAVDAPMLITGAPETNASIGILVNNRGLLDASGISVTVELDPVLTFLDAIPPPLEEVLASTSGNVYTWNAPDLSYLSQGLIMISTGVPSATIGSRYPVTISVSSTGSDANQNNNTIVTEVMVAEQLYLPSAQRGDD